MVYLSRSNLVFLSISWRSGRKSLITNLFAHLFNEYICVRWFIQANDHIPGFRISNTYISLANAVSIYTLNFFASVCVFLPLYMSLSLWFCLSLVPLRLRLSVSASVYLSMTLSLSLYLSIFTYAYTIATNSHTHTNSRLIIALPVYTLLAS